MIWHAVDNSNRAAQLPQLIEKVLMYCFFNRLMNQR
jgi:hypothetical protein